MNIDTTIEAQKKQNAGTLSYFAALTLAEVSTKAERLAELSASGGGRYALARTASRWAALAKEMRKAGASTVGELGDEATWDWCVATGTVLQRR